MSSRGPSWRWRPENHRAPPKPVHWRAPRGQCRFCGGAITKPTGEVDKRRNWHQRCADIWKLMNDPACMRAHVARRDGGRCAMCGTVSAAWEADHRKPLHRAQGDLTCWLPSNVQTLCTSCHGHKSRQEMVRLRSERAGLPPATAPQPTGRRALDMGDEENAPDPCFPV